MEKERGIIVRGGMGGFLTPPTHPEQTHHVQTDLKRKLEDRGSMSLSYAVESGEWLHDSTRLQAQQMLHDWQNHKPTIESPEVQDWIRQVLGYFRGCYSGLDKQGNVSWKVGDLRILKDADPMLNIDIHAGVNHIRKYYPEFTPTAEMFSGAYWGTKPEEKSA